MRGDDAEDYTAEEEEDTEDEDVGRADMAEHGGAELQEGHHEGRRRYRRAASPKATKLARPAHGTRQGAQGADGNADGQRRVESPPRR